MLDRHFRNEVPVFFYAFLLATRKRVAMNYYIVMVTNASKERNAKILATREWAVMNYHIVMVTNASKEGNAKTLATRD